MIWNPIADLAASQGREGSLGEQDIWPSIENDVQWVMSHPNVVTHARQPQPGVPLPAQYVSNDQPIEFEEAEVPINFV